MKNRIRHALRLSFVYIVIALQVIFLSQPLSLPAYAQEIPPAETIPAAEEPAPEPPCVPPSDVRWPTGSASATYAYNCDNGLWENDYYSWNPATSYTVAKYTPEHRFNSDTGKYDVYEWVYSAPKAKYLYVVTASYAPTPPPASENPDPPAPTNNPEVQQSTTPATETVAPLNLKSSPDSASVSPSVITYDSGYMTDVDLNVYVDVVNNVDSSAVSGDAAVLQNTVAGSATTGSATTTANIMNMIQSAFGAGGLMPTLYTADIQGDYVGDIIIEPSALAGAAANSGCDCELDVNATFDASIENNVNLLAQSGGATVSSNTNAGDATTGDATAVANIVNMISSSIAAGESFVGILNVHGNLEGDVLLADNVIDQLIAANVPTVDINLCSCNLSADLSADLSISNDITATAASGSATVANNTSAGSATTGSAATNVTVFNLTGRHLVGQDALLVFVNVAGEWVGFITDAPTGSTSALIGGGISTSTVNGNVNADVSATINNNVNVEAYSGDAEVSNNTNAGNATTGDANANVNIANIVNSNFSLSGWFGLLFINIFGDWHGSFGTNTPYGNAMPSVPVVMPAMNISSPASGVVGSANGPAGANRVRAYAVSLGASSGQNGAGTVLTSATEIKPNSVDLPEENFGAPVQGSDYTLAVMFGVLALTYIVIFQRDWIAALFKRG